MLEKYPDDIRLVLKSFPLPMHPYSRKAAVAALAANKQGKYWEFSRKLFENFQSLSDAKVKEIVKQLGMNAEKFNRDIEDPAIQAIVARDIEEGNRSDVGGTPTIFVNGKAIRNGPPELLQTIEQDLKQKKK